MLHTTAHAWHGSLMAWFSYDSLITHSCEGEEDVLHFVFILYPLKTIKSCQWGFNGDLTWEN